MFERQLKKSMLKNGKDVVESESFDRLCDAKELMKEIGAAAFDRSKKRRMDE